MREAGRTPRSPPAGVGRAPRWRLLTGRTRRAQHQAAVLPPQVRNGNAILRNFRQTQTDAKSSKNRSIFFKNVNLNVMSMSVSRGPHHPRARACSHIRTHVCVMKFDVMKYKDSLTKCSDIPQFMFLALFHSLTRIRGFWSPSCLSAW